MKTLFLMRHAEAEPHAPSDSNRRLSHYGVQQARNVGQALQMMKHPDLILVSPAERTKGTAILVAEEARYRQVEIRSMPLLYQASVDTLQEVIMSTDHLVNCLMVIAHNPSLSNLLEHLHLKESHNQALLCGFVYPTAAVVSLTAECDNWAEFFKDPAHVDFILLK